MTRKLTDEQLADARAQRRKVECEFDRLADVSGAAAFRIAVSPVVLHDKVVARKLLVIMDQNYLPGVPFAASRMTVLDHPDEIGKELEEAITTLMRDARDLGVLPPVPEE
jgi:hypothetical protein